MSKARSPQHGADRATKLRRRLQRALFASLYRFGGRVYDPLTVLLFGGAWARWRASVVPFLADGPALDLGCGTGALAESLAARGFDVVGLDREPSMLHRARSRGDLQLRLVRGDATQLPFISSTFASCVATFPANFILQQTALDEIVRVLRPEGVFVVVRSGYTENGSLRRQPIRFALRLFYGERSADQLPDGRYFEHPELSGDWTWVKSGEDRVLLWVGNRSNTG